MNSFFTFIIFHILLQLKIYKQLSKKMTNYDRTERVYLSPYGIKLKAKKP
jgi:hypothetical protein